MRNDEKHVAIHEAGHAVIGRVLGLPSHAASIIPNEAEGEAGSSFIADPWEAVSSWEKRGRYREVRSAYRARIIHAMAGAEAEILLLGHCEGGDGDDRRWIEIIAETSDSELPAELWIRYEPRMRRQTQRLVRKYKLQIERVASALLKHRILSGADIDTLLGESRRLQREGGLYADKEVE